MYDGFSDDGYGYFDGSERALTKRELRKAHAPAGVHVPNKQEAQLLRKLMSQHSLTEEEVRSHATYREMLSEAQKAGQLSDRKAKTRRKATNLMKRITRELKLPKEHPTVREKFTLAVKSDKDFLFASIPIDYLLRLIQESRNKHKDARKLRHT